MSCWVCLVGLAQESKFLQSHSNTLHLPMLPLLYNRYEIGTLVPSPCPSWNFVELGCTMSVECLEDF